MKLRNKITRKVYSLGEDIHIAHTEGGIIEVEIVLESGWFAREYFDSLAEFNGEWEDVKEPLIKDEKIRKAVRAWAEMNGIRFIRMCSRTRKENARIVGQNALGRTFTMEIDNEYEIRVSFKDYKECYTLTELCGKEQE